MSIFTPLRSKGALRTVVIAGTILKFTPAAMSAQQNQSVDIKAINGTSPLLAYCDDSTAVLSAILSATSSGTSAPVIQGNASTNPSYVCGYDLVTGAQAVTVKFIRGTSTDCSSNLTNVSPSYPFSSLAGLVRANGGAPQFIVPSSQSLCVSAGSSGVFGLVTYVTK